MVAVEKVTALVLAGASGVFARQGKNKNFLPLRGRPVVQYVLDTLAETSLRRIFLVTDPERASELDLPDGTVVLPASRRQWDNISQGVQAGRPWRREDRLLLVFGDTPLLRPAEIEDFLERCGRNDAVVHHGVVPQSAVDPFVAYFPEGERNRRPFAAGEFWARPGALTLLQPARLDLERMARPLDMFMAGRKQNPPGGPLPRLKARGRFFVTCIRLLGPGGIVMALKFVAAHFLQGVGLPRLADIVRRRLPLSVPERAVERILGCPVRLLPCPFGAASLDVDDEESLAVLEVRWEELNRLADAEMDARLPEEMVGG